MLRAALTKLPDRPRAVAEDALVDSCMGFKIAFSTQLTTFFTGYLRPRILICRVNLWAAQWTGALRRFILDLIAMLKPRARKCGLDRVPWGPERREHVPESNDREERVGFSHVQLPPIHVLARFRRTAHSHRNGHAAGLGRERRC